MMRQSMRRLPRGSREDCDASHALRARSAPLTLVGSAGLAVRRQKGLGLWQALAIVSLGSFSLHAGLGVGGDALDSFFNKWFYSGLLLLACAALIARGLLVRAERSAWLLLAA